MERFKLFSERNAEQLLGDVYSYDDIPKKLRVQTLHILNNTFTNNNTIEAELSEVFWESVEKK